MPTRRRAEVLRQVAARLAKVDIDDDRLPDEALRAIELWEKHPWNWLSSDDPLNPGRPLVWTKDERNQSDPFRPFPKELEYIEPIVDCVFTAHGDGKVPVTIAIDKARQKYMSTTLLLYFDWEARFHPARRILWSKSTEDEAKEMLKDKIRTPYSLLPEWVKQKFWMSDGPEVRVDYGKSLAERSYISGVAENVAVRDARGGTATMIGIDEAARQQKLRDILSAAGPMTDKIIMLTTADIGTDGAECFKEYLKDTVMAGVVELNPL